MSRTGRELSPEPDDVTRLMRVVSEKALEVAADITLLFVVNLQSGEVADLGPEGVLNTAQYYTRDQADEIIRSLQGLGVTVQSFFSELEFLASVVANDWSSGRRRAVVFTTAEGGSGSGRRALVPAVCNLLGLPVFNSGAHACSIARHKFHANAVLDRVGVRVPAAWLFSDDGWISGHRPGEGSRVIVKPTYESMCIGVGEDSVQVVGAGFEQFVQEKNRQYAQPVLVEEFISGEEVGVPLVRLGSTYALPPVAFRRANGERYGDRPRTFLDENIDHDTSHAIFEAEPAQYAAVQNAAVLSFDALQMRGVGRIDLRVDADGRAWVFDTNESPPPLSHTAYSIAMETLGFSLDEMLAVWLGVCLFDYGIISGL